MKFVIERKHWLRGEGYKFTYLLCSEDQKACCLGFFAQQVLGWTVEQILDKHELYEIDANLNLLTQKETHDIIINLIVVNDDIETSDLEKENKLKDLFFQLGHEVEFV